MASECDDYQKMVACLVFARGLGATDLGAVGWTVKSERRRHSVSNWLSNRVQSEGGRFFTATNKFVSTGGRFSRRHVVAGVGLLLVETGSIVDGTGRVGGIRTTRARNGIVRRSGRSGADFGGGAVVRRNVGLSTKESKGESAWQFIVGSGCGSVGGGFSGWMETLARSRGTFIAREVVSGIFRVCGVAIGCDARIERPLEICRTANELTATRGRLRANKPTNPCCHTSVKDPTDPFPESALRIIGKVVAEYGSRSFAAR